MTDGFFPRSDMDPSEMARRLRDSRSPRDHAMALLRKTLLDQQLDAIKALMRRHDEEREGEGYQFEVLDTDPRWNGDYGGGLEARRDERFWQLTFQASAHNMAAVGMLAPFREVTVRRDFRRTEDPGRDSGGPPAPETDGP